MSRMETWELWYPGAAATGLPFARSRIDPAEVVWVHATPEIVAVTVRDADGNVIAESQELRRAGERFPMTRLAKQGRELAREDRWPTPSDLGAVVILPGGEAGTLERWWHAEDGSEWRWQVEFYNHQ